MEKPNFFNISFGNGENHVAALSTMPKGFAKSIVNFDIDDQGLLLSRGEFIATAFPDAHSVFVVSTGAVLAVSGGAICLAGPPNNWIPIVSAGGTVAGIGSRVWWCEENGYVYYSDGVVNGVIKADGQSHPWGVPNPLVRDANGLEWVSVVNADGEESGAVLTTSTGAADERVYKPTGTIGTDEFADARGTALYRLDGDPHGKICDVKGLIPFPPCTMIGVWEGRAWGVIDNLLIYSQPLRYGLHDPAYDYVELPSTITMVGEVKDGYYISTDKVMYYVKGSDPHKWVLEPTTDAPAYYGSGIAVPTDYLDAENLKIPKDMTTAQAWLSKNGICYGFDSGAVRSPGANIQRIPFYNDTRPSLIVRDGMVQIIYSCQN
jgi:hypothetical protein